MSLDYDPTSELRQAWQAAIAICKPGVGYNEIGGVIEAVVAKVRSPLSYASSSLLLSSLELSDTHVCGP